MHSRDMEFDFARFHWDRSEGTEKGRAFAILRDKQPETIEDMVREPMTKLRDRVGTGIQDRGVERVGRREVTGGEKGRTRTRAGSSGRS